jgi:toxin ParE1/3/4
MVEIIWTQNALNDVDNCAEYIAIDSKQYAKLFVARVLQKVKILGTNSMAGRVVPELNKTNIRELIFGNYRVIYRLDSEKVFILTVYHCARILDLDF